MANEKVGVFGSAVGASDEVMEKARELGLELARREVIIITGACSGIPYEVAKTAFDANKTPVWGFSPTRSWREQKEFTPDDDLQMYEHPGRLIFVPRGYFLASDTSVAQKYRNVTSTATCDAGIIVSGRIGTLNEATNLFDMGKVIGVLEGTGGIADFFSEIVQEAGKKPRGFIIYDSSPRALVEQVLEAVAIHNAKVEIAL